MGIPVYTELSNFSVRKAGNKVQTDLTISLIINKHSDPVDTINSLYTYVNKSEVKIELLIVNMDREGYKYEKLMDNFPALRVLLPQEEISYWQAMQLIIQESLSEQILFMDESCKLLQMDLVLLRSYFTQSSFGALVPRMVNEHNEAIPNLVKASLRQGFIDTISVILKGSAMTSLYPKVPCFILSKKVFLQREIDLSDYQDRQFLLLELGYRLWKEGLLIFQGEKFKVQLLSDAPEDIREDLNNNDYLLFNFANITDKGATRGRAQRIWKQALLFLVSLRWNKLGGLIRSIRENSARANKNSEYPIDDSTVFHTVNKDYN